MLKVANQAMVSHKWRRSALENLTLQCSSIALAVAIATVTSSPVLAQDALALASAPEVSRALVTETAKSGADSQDTQSSGTTEPAAPADQRLQMDEIVVTARRVAEKLQDIPASISAVTGDQVERMTSLSDIQSLVSGVTFKSFGPIPTVGVRGFGNRTVAGSNANSTVGIFQDGVYVAPPLVVLINRVDSERVEVAKGPQSTLFGRSSYTGAINVVSNDPAREFSGYFDAGYGGSSVHGENLWHVRGAVSLPLSDTLYIRLFALREKRDGFSYDSVTGNRGNGYDRKIGRVKLLWEPSEDVAVRLTGTIIRDNLTRGLVQSGRARPPLGQTVLFNNPTNPAINAALQFGRTVWDGVYPDPVLGKTEGEQATLDLRFQTPMGELASLTDYQHSYQLVRNALDLTRLNIAIGQTRFQEKRWSQELRLSNDIGRLSYLLGLYYLHVEAKQNGGKSPDFVEPSNTYNPGSIQYDLRNQRFGEQPSFTETDAYAAFGQIGYDITDKLNLTVGLRHGSDRIAGTTGQFFQLRTGAQVVSTPITYRKAEFKATTGSANLSYKIATDAIVYASYARGDSPGGLNSGGAARINFAPQKVSAFEIGLKSQLFDRRLRLNLALFNNDYSDLHLTQNTFVAGVLAPLVSNAGDARGRGVDFDAAAILSSNWRVNLQYTYADSKITRYNIPAPPAPQVSFAGVPLVRSPKHTLNASVTFTQEIGPGKFQLTVDENYTSSYTNDYQGVPAGTAYPGIPGVLPPGTTTTQVLALFRTPGYAITNLNARYSWDAWEISGYVRNVFNHEYLAAVLGFSPTIYPYELPGEPRTFEISLKYKF